MNRKISPFWALWAGFVMVPLACGVNALTIPLLIGRQTTFDAQLSWLQILQWSWLGFVFCAPLGFLTFTLIRHWNGAISQKHVFIVARSLWSGAEFGLG